MTVEIATRIVRTLFEKGFTAYFAGGWVRDYLLKLPSDEIDIATNAPPEKIREIFPKTVAVGISFGVVVVIVEGINFEVTTFRKDLPYEDGRHPTGVDYSTPEKDAQRRDFTINGMFFDPLTKEILDYVQGKEDLKKGVIRAIGDPHERFREDRLRMLRAVRFSARFGFRIEEKTKEAIQSQAKTLLPAVSLERIWQELSKMSRSSRFDEALAMLHELGLLQTIFPDLATTSLETLKKRLSFFPYFPLETPTIIFLLELFQGYDLEKRISLCKFLKISGSDKKLVEFFTHSEGLFQKTPEKREWVYFYAHPHSALFLEVKGAHLFPPEKNQFHAEHTKRKKELHSHIQRVQQKDPVLKGEDLQKEGVLPGKQMGHLLKEGEKMAIDHDLDDPQSVIKMLKHHHLL